MPYVKKIKVGEKVKVMCDLIARGNGYKCIINAGEIGEVISNHVVHMTFVKFNDFECFIRDINLNLVNYDQDKYIDVWFENNKILLPEHSNALKEITYSQEEREEIMKILYENQEDVEDYTAKINDEDDAVRQFDNEHNITIKMSDETLREILENLKEDGLVHFAPKVDFIVNYIKSRAEDKLDKEDWLF